MTMSEGQRLSFYANFMSLPLLLGCFAVAVLLVALFYRLVYRVVPRPVLLLLIALRNLAILILLLLIFKPVVRYTYAAQHRASLALLVDTSRSMSVRDFPNSPGRLERVAAELGPRLADLGRAFDLRVYAFDTLARRLGDGEPLPLEAAGDATHLSRAVLVVLDELAGENLTALVIFSDGIHNGGGDPLAAILERRPPPVSTVAVGSDLSAQSGFQDIGITGLDVPDEATVNTRTTIGVRLDATGFADRTVDVQLRDGEITIAAARLVLDGRPGSQEVRLQVTPERKGSLKYEVVVPQDPKERIQENNRHEFHLWVTEPRIKVLYVETLRPEYGPLKQVLETDPNIDVLALVQYRQGVFLKSGNLADLDVSAFPRTRDQMRLFDVFIIGSLDSSFLTQAQMEALRDLVRDEGKGLLMIGGTSGLGAGGYGATPIEDVLPVRLGTRSVGQIAEPFTMELTPEGLAHDVFSGTGDFFRYQGRTPRKELPVLRGCNRLAAVRPGAAVLARHPGVMLDGKPAPVLVTQPPGSKVRSTVFAGDTTSQWDVYFKVLGLESPYARFWGQLVRHLAGKDVEKRQTEPGLAFALRKPVFRPAEPIVFQATVTEQEGRATNFAAVRAEIIGPDGRTRTESLPNVPGSVGLYRATRSFDDAGQYAVAIVAEKDGLPLGRVTAEFAVARPNQEFETLAANESLLEALARDTRGDFCRLTTLTDLLERLNREQLSGAEPFEWRLVDHVVGRLPGTRLVVTMTHLLFAAFLALVTAEWLVRRRYLLQ